MLYTEYFIRFNPSITMWERLQLRRSWNGWWTDEGAVDQGSMKSRGRYNVEGCRSV
jgi:hypothetical protein